MSNGKLNWVNVLKRKQERIRRREQQITRLIGLFARGKCFTKEQIAELCNISRTTVSRKIAIIRAFLLKRSRILTIDYNRASLTYCMHFKYKKISGRVSDFKEQQLREHIIVALKVKGLTRIIRRNPKEIKKYRLAKQQNELAKTSSVKLIEQQLSFPSNKPRMECLR